MPVITKDLIQSLHETVGEDYDLGTLESFRKSMADPKIRDSFYKTVQDDFELGDFKKFDSSVVAALTPPAPTIIPTPGQPKEPGQSPFMKSDGTYSPFPQDGSDIKAKGEHKVVQEEELRKNLGIDPIPMTVKEGIGSFAGNFNKTVVGAVSGVSRTAAIVRKGADFLLTNDSKPLEYYDAWKFGDFIDKKALEWGLTATDPKSSGSFFLEGVPSGLASVMVIAASGGSAGGSPAIGKQLIKTATADLTLTAAARNSLKELGTAMLTRQAAVGANMSGVSQMREALNAGASDQDAILSYLAGAGIGATDAIPIERAFSSINQFTGGKVMQVLKSGTKGSLEEATQEGIQQYLSNKVAQGLYDPNREPWDDMISNMGVGGFVGFLLPGVMSAMNTMPTAQKNETQKALRAVIERYQANKEKTLAAIEKPLGNPETTINAPEGPLGKPAPVQNAVQKAAEKIAEPEVVKEAPPNSAFVQGTVELTGKPIATDTDGEGNRIQMFGTGLRDQNGDAITIDTITDPDGNVIHQALNGAIVGSSHQDVVNQLISATQRPPVEGDYVDYGGVKGRLIRDSDKNLVVHTDDGDFVTVESGLSGKPLTELGVSVAKAPQAVPKELTDDKADINSPMPDNQIGYNFETGSVTLYGKPFKYDGVEVDNKGETTAIRLIDAKGNTKFVRNQDAIYEIQIQKLLAEEEISGEQIDQAAKDLNLTKKNEPANNQTGSTPEPVQQGGSTENTQKDKARKKQKGKSPLGIKQAKLAIAEMLDADDEANTFDAIHKAEAVEEEYPGTLTKEQKTQIESVRENLKKGGFDTGKVKVGQSFNGKTNATIDDVVPDPTLPEGKEVISKIIKPAIFENGKMIRPPHVVVSVGVKSDGKAKKPTVTTPAVTKPAKGKRARKTAEKVASAKPDKPAKTTTAVSAKPAVVQEQKKQEPPKGKKKEFIPIDITHKKSTEGTTSAVQEQKPAEIPVQPTPGNSKPLEEGKSKPELEKPTIESKAEEQAQDVNKEEVQKVEPVQEAEEQYVPLEQKDVHPMSKFTKDDAQSYDTDEKEGANGRMYEYVSSITVGIENTDGDQIGALVKNTDDEGTVTWNAEDADGNQLFENEDADTRAEAEKKILDKWNRAKRKEFDKEKKAQAKKKSKAEEKAKRKAEGKKKKEEAKVESKPAEETKPTEEKEKEQPRKQRPPVSLVSQDILDLLQAGGIFPETTADFIEALGDIPEYSGPAGVARAHARLDQMVAEGLIVVDGKKITPTFVKQGNEYAPQDIESYAPESNTTVVSRNNRSNKPMGLTAGFGAFGPNWLMDIDAPIVKAFVKLVKSGYKGLTTPFNFRGNVTEPIFRSQNASLFTERQYQVRAVETAKLLYKRINDAYGSPTESQIIGVNLALEGKTTTPDGKPLNIPIEVQRVVNDMRLQIDNLTRRMVRAGLIEGTLAFKVMENMGVYLHRSYQKHSDPLWKDNVNPLAYDKAMSFLKTQYPGYTPEQMQPLIDYLLTSPDAPMSIMKGGSWGTMDLSVLKPRGDIAPEIRALWGEYAEPITNFTRSVAKMSQLVAKHQFQQDVINAGLAEKIAPGETYKEWLARQKKSGKFLFEEPVEGHLTPIETTDAKGVVPFPLSGLYTTKENAKIFEKYHGGQQDAEIFNFYVRANSAVNKGLTVWNPAGQGKNFFGGAVFASMQGHLGGWGFDLATKQMTDEELQSAEQTRAKFLAAENQLNTLKRQGLEDTALYNKLRDVIDQKAALLKKINDAIDAIKANKKMPEATRKVKTSILKQKAATVEKRLIRDRATIYGKFDNAILSKAQAKLAAVVADPKSTPEQIKSAEKKVNTLLNRKLLAKEIADGLARSVQAESLQKQVDAMRETVSELDPFASLLPLTSKQKRKELWIAHGLNDDSAVGAVMREYWQTNAGKNGLHDIPNLFSPQRVKQVVGKILGAPEKAYRGADTSWKYIAFEIEYARYRKAYPTKSEKEIQAIAAEIVKSVYPTQSRAFPVIKYISRYVPFLGGFSVFPAETVRVMLNTVRIGVGEMASGNATLAKIGARRMVGVATAVSVFSTAALLTRALLGMDDKDEEAFRVMLPEWSKNSQLLFVNKKTLNVNGVVSTEYTYIDESSYDPNGLFKKPVIALLFTDKPIDERCFDFLYETLRPFTNPQVLFQKVDEARMNVDANGNKIWLPTDTEAIKWEKIYKYVGANIAPGYAKSIIRLQLAAKQTQAEHGKKYKLEDEIWAAAGIRMSTVNVTEWAERYATSDINAQLRGVARERNQKIKQPGLTKEEIKKINDEYIRANRRALELAKRKYDAAIRLGADPRIMREIKWPRLMNGHWVD